jgi:hypothetical protein
MADSLLSALISHRFQVHEDLSRLYLVPDRIKRAPITEERPVCSAWADRLLRESGETLEAADRLEAQRYQALAHSMLDAEVFEAAWQEGQTPALELQLWQLMSAK